MKSKKQVENNEELELDNEVTPKTETEIDYQDKYTRLLAEYSNFAKQKEVEMSSMAKFANKNLILKILDILDDLDAGLMQENIVEETRNILSILKSKMEHLITLEGVLEMEIKNGDVYSADKCEVVQTVDSLDQAGKIIQVLRKGYTMSDRVLRTAKVIVGK